VTFFTGPRLIQTDYWKMAGATPKPSNILSNWETSGGFLSQVSFRSHISLLDGRNDCNICLLHAHPLSLLAPAVEVSAHSISCRSETGSKGHRPLPS